MWKIIRVVQLAVVVPLLTVSCTQNPTDGSGLYDKEYVDFTIELQPPGGYTPAESRAAMTDQEQNVINTAIVLVYNSADQTLFDYKQVSVTSNRLTVNLKTSQKESDVFDIVVIGNHPDFTPTLGEGKAKLQTELTRNVKGKWTGSEFIMWGERKNTFIKPATNNFKIEMLRSLARIDIGVGVYDPATDTWLGLADFKLYHVYVVNRRDKFAIMPLDANVNSKGKVKVTAPSIPSGTGVQGKTPTDALMYAEIQDGTVTGRAYINSGIFVAEAPNMPENERLTLIIGATYKNSSQISYYRVDFCVPKIGGAGYDYLPILRNHRYRITITGVQAAGARTPELALAAPSMNILTTLDPISESEDENGGDILFNDQYYIKTDVSEVLIYGKPDGVAEQELVTVKAGTKAGAQTTGTITGISSESVTLANGVPYLVKVPIAKHNDYFAGDSPRTFEISFGTLKKKIQYIYKASPLLVGSATAIPFTDVASITTDGADWITFSHNSLYVKSEQKEGFIEGNAGGKTYIHIAENTTNSGDDNRLGPNPSRTTQAIVKYNNGSTTRVILVQERNEIFGYFGGEPELPSTEGDGTVYPKQVAFLRNNYFKTNPVGQTSVQYMFKTDRTRTHPTIIENESKYYGRKMNVAAAALSGTETLDNYPAFKFCANLNRDVNGDGIIDDSEMIWYLPSYNQLAAFYVFSRYFYDSRAIDLWSANSTDRDDDNNQATWLALSGKSSGLIGSGYKNTLQFVMCVRDVTP